MLTLRLVFRPQAKLVELPQDELKQRLGRLMTERAPTRNLGAGQLRVEYLDERDDVLHSAHVARFGTQLFGRHLIGVEVVGALLMAALVGALAIVIQGNSLLTPQRRAAL